MSTPRSSDRYLIGALLIVPFQVIRRRVYDALIEQGYDDLRSAHLPVFQWLDADGSRISVLAEASQMTRQSMGELIDYLERCGYVVRTPDPSDKRATLIQRTERGWEVNRISRAVVEQIEAEWAEELGQEAFAQLVAHLRRLVGVLNEPAGVAGHERIQPHRRDTRS